VNFSGFYRSLGYIYLPSKKKGGKKGAKKGAKKDVKKATVNNPNEIKAYSLISFDPKRKVFSIHPLVHAWGRTIFANPESDHSIMGAILA
jgi:hypothetical protein